ncbi:MAG: YbaB/EbfC family nucleoid-associated protein [Ruminococcus sp.]|jgi:DNA-binding YbaB/EbfC family protein|nr:YbaB/EbfC family nucleoid-associated protein [Ruminococcus sp.]
MKARLPQGFGGGTQNMQQMVKQAQSMQSRITEIQEEIEEREFDITVGGGAVSLKMKGNKEVTAVKIKPEAVDPEDVEMLEDLLMSAFNEGIKQIAAVSEEELGKVTGGVSFPGLF